MTCDWRKIALTNTIGQWTTSTYQQCVHALILTLGHFHRDTVSQYNLETLRLILLKIKKKTRKVPIKLINTTETFKIIHYKGHNWKIIHTSFPKKQFFIHQGWLLHSSRNCYSNGLFLCHWPLGLLLHFFSICPENTFLCRKHVRISLCIAMLGVWKANAQLLLLALSHCWGKLHESGILTGMEEMDTK